MEGAFAWVNAFFDAVFSIFPRLLVLPTTEGAVKFVFGRPKAVKSGSISVWWPLVTKLYTMPIVRQTLNLPSQVIMTRRDGDQEESKSICLSGIVVYDIEDVTLALTQVHDLDEAISDLGLAAIKETLWGKTLSEIYQTSSSTDTQIRNRLTKKLAIFGVKVHNVFISDCSTCMVIKTMADTRVSYIPMKEDESED